MRYQKLFQISIHFVIIFFEPNNKNEITNIFTINLIS